MVGLDNPGPRIPVIGCSPAERVALQSAIATLEQQAAQDEAEAADMRRLPPTTDTTTAVWRGHEIAALERTARRCRTLAASMRRRLEQGTANSAAGSSSLGFSASTPAPAAAPE